MVKLKAPLMSLNARGRISKLFSLARRQGQNIIERKPVPTDAKSPAQLFNRHMFTKCVDLWHLLSSAEQQEWESLARPRHMSGYAWYISQCLRPNPGIYLPLQGGTMSGNILMATNRILELPDPLVNQEAATKAYADTHGMQAHENTHTLGQADEIDSALAIAAMAALTHNKIWQGNAGNRPVEITLPVADAFYSEANDLSDVTSTVLARADQSIGSRRTLLNIVSGGCRFFGGVVYGESVGVDLEVTVDGGAKQSFPMEYHASEGAASFILQYTIPPIKCDDTLLISIYNSNGSKRYTSGLCWHRAL